MCSTFSALRLASLLEMSTAAVAEPAAPQPVVVTPEAAAEAERIKNEANQLVQGNKRLTLERGPMSAQ